jgi:hypothetical protein
MKIRKQVMSKMKNTPPDIKLLNRRVKPDASLILCERGISILAGYNTPSVVAKRFFSI